ncbi:GNAT family N-acetyltransferase [Shewanella submarina]|uniref:GNAT family N-acetyltransferase n=1 Tax=Shewanella submarina TaxID=2016376 RepID=A0ABV7GGS2_9GAMM|nr:GNAT family N-acetyltransferase [Shewanella submarina]MCL1039714.1 GNAT family N-acetyltransferase [Shewanella submarina]
MMIQTERLTLSHLDETDADFMLALLNSQGFLSYIGDRGVRTQQQAVEYILDGPVKSYRENGFGMYRVQLKATGDIVGLCGLVKRPQLEHVDIGYALLPEYFGQGYAIEACVAVMQEAKEKNIHPVVAIVDSNNGPSISLLKKLGLRFHSTIKLSPDDSSVDLYR